MSDSWDEGPVADLRARIAELTKDRDDYFTALGDWMVMHDRRVAERDRAIAAVRQLRAQLQRSCYRWDMEASNVLAATAEWDT